MLKNSIFLQRAVWKLIRINVLYVLSCIIDIERVMKGDDGGGEFMCVFTTKQDDYNIILV